MYGWQQRTGAVDAKVAEDTALHRYPRLLALNEVGSFPGAGPVLSVSAFHRGMRERAPRRPDGLTATTTHGTKWGEEVRGQLSVLCERPDRRRAILRAWDRSGGAPRGVRHRDRFLLEQAAFGSFPFGPAEGRGFPERFAAYAHQALRETRQGTSWMRPRPAYEERGLRYIGRSRTPAAAFSPAAARAASVSGSRSRDTGTPST